MAIDINGSLVIDETSGTQNSADSGDSSGNDIANGTGVLPAEFDAVLLQEGVSSATATGVAVSGATADNSTGTAMITNLGDDVVNVSWTNSSGDPLNGVAAMFGAGAGDFLLTTDGRKIWLYTSGFDDNVVIGRADDGDGVATAADEDGDVVFAAYLDTQTAAAGDAGATGIKVWLVQYLPILHGIAGSAAAAHDDARSLFDSLYVTVSNLSNFDLAGAPSGQNLFLMFGEADDGIVGNGIGDDNVAIVVTGKEPANQSTGASITTGDTVNTGQGGGGTTLGTNNQMVDPLEGLYFTFVRGANPNYTVPNLDQNEADVESNIDFQSLYNATAATFTVVQLQPPKASTLKISAFNTAYEPGTAFVDGLANDGGPADIDQVMVTTTRKVGKNVVVDVWTFVDDDTTTPQIQDGITVTFLADGTVTIKGIEAGDRIEYQTSGTHNRVLIENVGTENNYNSSFDIGGFALVNSNTQTTGLNVLSFEDDGPSIDANTAAVPTLTTDDTDIEDTDGPTSFAGLFDAPDFGADGFKDSDDDDLQDADAITYALGVSAAGGVDSGLVDTLSGDKIYLYLEGVDVVGRVGQDNDGGADAAGAVAFTISVNASGGVTLVQSRSVVHDDAADPAETGASSAGLAAASLVTLTATATDGDGDTDSATRNIGDAFKFEDDGPDINANATAVPTLTTDDTDIPDSDGPTSFAGVFDAPDFGSDGFKDSDDDDLQDADAITYALGVSSAGADSGLVDTLSGKKIFLFLQSGVVNGRVGNASNLADAAGAVAFSISIDAGTAAVSLTQNRSIVHDDPNDPAETGASAAGMAASLVTLNATVTDGDGDTDSASRNIGDAFKFEDGGPSLAFGNLVGTGTTLAQTGYWTMDAGSDGLGAAGLDISLTGFTLVRPDSSTTAGTFEFDEEAGSPDGNGNYLFSGTLTGDFDDDAGTDDTSADFTLVAYADGHYELQMDLAFGSTITLDTADGALKAGGPDSVQTLVIPKPPATPITDVVFFSAKALADPADIQPDLDLNEAQLETAAPSYIDFARGMNVSTSGIGVANNLLEGDATAGVGVADESFVVNPEILVSSMEVFIDNSVQGYAYSKGEELYYRVYYDDGTFSANTLVTTDLGLTNKGQADSFTIDGGAKLIDAVQLTMGKGDVKIPHIVLATETESLASHIQLDFLATVTDRDGDPATSAFTALLLANELEGGFDFVMSGTATEQDSFNIDLTSDFDSYEVSGFEVGSDLLVLIGDATAVVDSIDNTGADSIVTISETGGQTTTIIVVGVDLANGDVVFG